MLAQRAENQRELMMTRVESYCLFSITVDSEVRTFVNFRTDLA